MKKFLNEGFACCFRRTLARVLWTVAVWAGISPALNAQTSSSDIVGFQRVDLQEGRNFVALPFLPPTNSLAGVLGSSLPSGDTVAAATVADFWDQANQTLTNRSWLSSNTNFTGWRAAQTFASAANLPLDPAKGFIITIRQGQTNQSVLLLGLVATNAQTQEIQNDGSTLAGSTYPVAVPLTNSALVASGFIGGASLPASDTLVFFNPETQLFDETIWYDTTSGTWRNADGGAATRALNPGEGFLINRLNRPAGNFTWTNPVPPEVLQMLQ